VGTPVGALSASPGNGTYSSSTPVTFSATYYNPDDFDYDTLTFDILDLTSSSTILSYLTPINQSGNITETAVVTLTPGDTYLWRPKAFSSQGSSTPIYGNWYTYTASSSLEITLNTAYNATVGTSTLPSATNLLSFLNVPYLMETKVPFALMFQAVNGIFIAINSSTTQSIPEGTATVYGIASTTGATSTTFEIFGPSSVQEFLPPSVQSQLRGIMVIALYAAFIFGLYREGKRLNII